MIDQRGLAPAVSFLPGQLDDAAFDREMTALDVLILPHADASMLVSGAFFEAAGRVPVILARDSSFVRWAEQRLPGVRRFASDDDLVQAVRALATEPRPVGADGGARRDAVALFGWAQCQRRYHAVLGPSGLAEVPA
ncbi:hypothetical protein [Ideonella sp. A 288]|uniref:hypothetical protein n=1 Tax=Ideonella sp. A 288 TaxID=1962181 RepID=UPI0013033621|nr:hypothetical protein [Ideonella sp. A 288]